MNFSNHRPEQTFGGVMLIGLAVLFLTGWWWPGILFVVGLALLARGQAEGTPWNQNIPALGALGVGVVFWLGVFAWNWLPLLLIGIGLYMLYGDRIKISTSRTDSAPAKRSQPDLQAEIDLELGRDPQQKAKNDDLV